jgi:hypothetical protein
MFKYFTIFLIFIAFNSNAQYIITGRVINTTDKNPLPLAVAFINNTGISTTTNNNGSFILHNVPAGRCRFLVTIIGYQPYQVLLNVTANVNLKDIELKPAIEALSEVTVKAKPKLSPYFYLFRSEFLGPSLFARQCKILNPYDIQFYDTDPRGGFSARSNKFIEVENDALGYKVKFLLNYFIKDSNTNSVYFSGESYFEVMKGSPGEERDWQKNRLECYQGSVMQLLRSIIADSVKENGYRIKRAMRKDNPYYNPNGLQVDPYDMDNAVDVNGDSDNTIFDDKISNGALHKKELLLTTSDKNLFGLAGVKDSTSNNSLYIEHIADIVPISAGKPVHVPWIWHSTVTFITFNKPYTIFDNTGKILNPRSVKYTGFFSEQTRLATELPSDYKPL